MIKNYLLRRGVRFPVPVLLILAATAVLLSCASKRPPTPDDPHWVDLDEKPIAEPADRDPSLAWTSIKRSVFDQIYQAFDMQRNLRILSGDREAPCNVNSFDEVPNCSWFTNRIGLFEVTPEQVEQGRVVTGGPDTTGTWLVFRPKLEGATPGFWIEDSRGNQYIIKFDPEGYPELATGAAAMGARYFYACGYNVPQETIVYWHPDMLRVKKGVTYRDVDGIKHELTIDVLNDVLAEVERDSSGHIRSLASLALADPKGPFSFSGRREDDPNDWCDHEKRRELRALKVIAALVNHYDLKDQNTLDNFVETGDGKGYLEHYLIDFGSTFGADGDSPKEPIKGYANYVDLRDIFVSFITLGTKTWAWEHADTVIYPSVGYFESKLFEPQHFNPIVPNPAFEDMSPGDAFWGAKIVMGFRDEHIRSLVRAGQYSNPAAEEYLVRTLIERRDKIGRYWFDRVNPLDNFQPIKEEGGYTINFDDLAVKYDMADAEQTAYRVRCRYRGNSVLDYRDLHETHLVISPDDLESMAAVFRASNKPDDPENHLYMVEIETKRDGGKWMKPTVLKLWYHDSEDRFQLVGLEHTY
jgi:hypothetical protein